VWGAGLLHLVCVMSRTHASCDTALLRHKLVSDSGVRFTATFLLSATALQQKAHQSYSLLEVVWVLGPRLL
jgi:hypothetical protein